MQYAFFLGRHATLAAAEIWRTLKRIGLQPSPLLADDDYLVIEIDTALAANFVQQLGGTHRIGQVIGQQSTPWTAPEILQLLSPLPAKLRVGVSVLGLPAQLAQQLGIALKKAARAQGTRLRFVSPSGNTSQLNAAQVLFNRLYEAPHRELTLLKHEDTHYLIQTLAVQDIAAYEQRDTSRPVRDARVGMLPPKLAQMMLNLIPEFSSTPPTILDPFCGLGTVVQEGWLMGYTMFGSDASERMVVASQKNLAALRAKGRLPSIFLHDVRQPFGPEFTEKFDAIVTEPHLGEPLTIPLSAEEASARHADLGELYVDFFRNARPILKADGCVVFVLPCYRVAGQSAWARYSPTLFDGIQKLGYALTHLVPKELQRTYEATERGTVIYARPNALVGRELTLWHIRKQEDQPN
ncbi:MAG TPA: hypothetical protein VJC05_03300 [Candidatus Andersenbacteria bacterium]|nr:MAG: hypothetical protein A2854_05180 [Parcubacteria group bacterium RIFCSPHIGHO2_01_FULL_56_18]HLD26042.1 hypothetical protein [Candidatus Andersenbacteria bacterium]